MEPIPVKEPHESDHELFSIPPELLASEKKIRQGRNLLFFIGGMQLIVGVFEYFSTEDPWIAWLAFGIDAFVGCIFVALGFLVKKRPFFSLLSGLILYILFILLLASFDLRSVTLGWIAKLFFILALVKSVKAAREAEALRKLSNPPV